MATNISLAGVNAGLNALGINAPVSSGLLAWFWPGTDRPTTEKNWALGANAPGAVVGSPTYHSGYASFKSSVNFMQATIPETNDATIFIVARSSDTFADNAHRPILIGTHEDGILEGVQIYVSATTGAPQASITCFGGYNPGTIREYATIFNSADFSAFKYIWFRITSGANIIQAHDETDNTGFGTVATTGTRVLKTTTFQIGSSYTATFQGTNDVAHCSIYNRSLTDPEVAAHYAFTKAQLLAKNSIAV